MDIRFHYSTQTTYSHNPKIFTMVSAPVKPRNTLITQIWILILTPIFFFALPACLLISIPIYLLRYLVSVSGTYLNSELGKIVPPVSAIYAADDMYNKPRNCVLAFITVQGTVEIQEFRQKCLEHALEQNSNGELKYSEGQQYILKWMGFYFWKWDRKFKIENHVREYNGQVKCDRFNERILHELNNEILHKPWVKNRSPWELYVFPNYRNENDEAPEIPKSLVIARYHHIIADAMSPLKLLFTTREGLRSSMPQPKLIYKSTLRKILDGFIFIGRAPYDVATTLVKSNDPFSQYHKPQEQLSLRNNLVRSLKIPVSHIKEVRDRQNIVFAGVVMAAFTSALRTLILEQWGEVPEYVTAAVALPKPGNSEKLANKFTGILVSLPVGIPDPVLRLRALQANFEYLKSSTLPLFAYIYFIAVGSLLPFMTKLLTRNDEATVDLSIVAGPNEQAWFVGLPVLDLTVNTGYGPGGIGIGLTSVSYNGNTRITVAIDENILPSSTRNMDGFMEDMLREMDILKHTESAEVFEQADV